MSFVNIVTSKLLKRLSKANSLVIFSSQLHNNLLFVTMVVIVT